MIEGFEKFLVTLSKSDKERLRRLAYAWSMPMTQYIRMLIKKDFEDVSYFSKYSGSRSVIARLQKEILNAINLLIQDDIDGAIKVLRPWVKRS